MEKVKAFSALLILTVLLTMALPARAQQEAPKEGTQSDGSLTVKEEIAELRSDDSHRRGEAAYRLGEMGNAAVDAVPDLIEVLNDHKPLEWVTESGESKKFTTAAEEAAEALVKIGDRRAVGPFLVLLTDSDPKVRAWAAKALGDMREDRAVESLIYALKDRDQAVEENAVLALAKIGDPNSVNILIGGLLKDDGSIAGARPAKALGKIGPMAVEPLIKVLKNKNKYAREGAVKALGEIGDVRAVEPLIDTLKDDDLYVRKKALESLRKITKEDHGEDYEKWRQWREKIKADKSEGQI